MIEASLLIVCLILIIHTIFMIFLSKKINSLSVSTDNASGLNDRVSKLIVQKDDGGYEKLVSILREGNYRMLILLSDKCSFCKKLLPFLNKHFEYETRGDLLILIGGRDKKSIFNFHSLNNIIFPYRYFLTKDSYRLNITSFPSIFYLSAGGAIVNNEVLTLEKLNSLLVDVSKGSVNL